MAAPGSLSFGGEVEGYVDGEAERAFVLGAEADVEVAPVDGELPAAAVVPDPARVAALAAAPERARWWIDRIRDCWPLLS